MSALDFKVMEEPWLVVFCHMHTMYSLDSGATPADLFVTSMAIDPLPTYFFRNWEHCESTRDKHYKLKCTP